MFRSSLLCVCALLLCVSCAARYQTQLDSLKGKPISAVLAQWPSPTYHLGNQYVWKTDALEQRGGYWERRPEMMRDYSGPAFGPGLMLFPPMEYVEPYSVRVWCHTTLYTNEAGVVVDSRVEGNNCGKAPWFTLGQSGQ